MIMLNQSSHYLLVGIKGANGPFLIFTHETTVTLNIGAEDGSEFAFNFFCSHGTLRVSWKVGLSPFDLIRGYHFGVERSTRIIHYDLKGCMVGQKCKNNITACYIVVYD
jgi:hypothetical protein